MFLATIVSLAMLGAPEAPLYEAEFLFPPEAFHNHSSSIGFWFQGHGYCCSTRCNCCVFS